MTRLALVALLLASCTETRSEAPARAPSPKMSCPACPPVAVSAKPPVFTADADPPKPADLERAKAILAQKPVVTETTPCVSKDGKRVAYVSEGALHLHDLTSKVPDTKLSTTLPQRFRRPSFSPDGASIYFTSDDHGDEAYAIHRVVLATGAIEPVIAGEKLRRDGPFFDTKGDLFFTARKLDQEGLYLYARATAGGEPQRIYADVKAELWAIRPDGKQILIGPTAVANEISAVELPNGTPHRLFPESARKVSVFDAIYSSDGTHAFVATDDGKESVELLSIDTKTGKIGARYVEKSLPKARVQELQASADHVAFVLDAGVRHEVRLLSAKTLQPIALAPMPTGSVVVGAQHPNSTGGLALGGGKLVVQWSTPELPARLFTVDTKTGAHTRVTNVENAAHPVNTSVEEIVSFDDLRIPTLVHRPAKPGKSPVIMVIHGGFPFASTAGWDALNALLLDEGYVIVEPNVRGSAGFGHAYEAADNGIKKLDGVRDFGMVARWIVKQDWADPKRLAVMGRSAGGYYTLMSLEHDPELYRAGVAVVPLYDLAKGLEAMDGDLRHFMEQRELVPLSDPMMLAAISPSHWVDRIAAPLFVYSGTRDVRTPVGQIDDLVRTLRSKEKPVEYMRVDEGHSLGPSSTRAEMFARIVRFLDERMR